MSSFLREFLSGNEAVASAALDAGVLRGIGYPGTPSTEILEYFSAIGGTAEWAPNEKVALEVGMGVAFGGGHAIVTMKHVGMNVAADPLFTAGYTQLSKGLVIVSADDPGMASSQNEQDSRRYAVASGLPLLEPSNSQEAYDMTRTAFTISEKWKIPVILRLTTRICHSKTVLVRQSADPPEKPRKYNPDVKARVMIPAYARPAHKKLRQKLLQIQTWNEESDLNRETMEEKSLGIIASGVAYMHAREASPKSSFLKLGMTYPLPIKRIRSFVKSVDKCIVIEEGDPYLVEAIRAAGIDVEGKLEMYRFGELNVDRVKHIIAGDTSEPVPAAGKPPALCQGCPHRTVFEALHNLDCIVAGDIGCYTLAALPPFEAIDTTVCMGASIGVGLGLRHVLPDNEARKVISVIGDSTFVHSGITGLVEMAYNPPKTGHLVIILDNLTTAMTGLQENPSTGRTLTHEPANRLVLEDLAKSIGIKNVLTLDPLPKADVFQKIVAEYMQKDELSLIIARQPCILVRKKIKAYQKAEE
jgi:indolepyruvate ferredoxin oxidoreductase alpha subunit